MHSGVTTIHMMLAWERQPFCIPNSFLSYSKDVSTQWQQHVCWTKERGSTGHKGTGGELGTGRGVPGQVDFGLNEERQTDGKYLLGQREHAPRRYPISGGRLRMGHF